MENVVLGNSTISTEQSELSADAYEKKWQDAIANHSMYSQFGGPLMFGVAFPLEKLNYLIQKIILESQPKEGLSSDDEKHPIRDFFIKRLSLKAVKDKKLKVTLEFKATFPNTEGLTGILDHIASAEMDLNKLVTLKKVNSAFSKNYKYKAYLDFSKARWDILGVPVPKFVVEGIIWAFNKRIKKLSIYSFEIPKKIDRYKIPEYRIKKFRFTAHKGFDTLSIIYGSIIRLDYKKDGPAYKLAERARSIGSTATAVFSCAEQANIAKSVGESMLRLKRWGDEISIINIGPTNSKQIPLIKTNVSNVSFKIPVLQKVNIKEGEVEAFFGKNNESQPVCYSRFQGRVTKGTMNVGVEALITSTISLGPVTYEDGQKKLTINVHSDVNYRGKPVEIFGQIASTICPSVLTFLFRQVASKLTNWKISLSTELDNEFELDIPDLCDFSNLEAYMLNDNNGYTGLEMNEV